MRGRRGSTDIMEELVQHLHLIFCYLLLCSNSIYLPTAVDELKEVASSLSLLAEEHVTSVLLFFCTAYLFKQSFGIPGSALLVREGGREGGRRVC